jgi:hypothetical protein
MVTEAVQSMPQIVASVGSIDDIRQVLRARFDALELSRTTIDEAAGLADGHASKLLAGLTGFGPLTLFGFGDRRIAARAGR